MLIGTSTWQETIEMNEGRNYAGTCIDTIEEKIYVVAGCLTKKASTAEKGYLGPGLHFSESSNPKKKCRGGKHNHDMSDTIIIPWEFR